MGRRRGRGADGEEKGARGGADVLIWGACHSILSSVLCNFKVAVTLVGALFFIRLTAHNQKPKTKNQSGSESGSESLAG